jgi:hypothetical protein
VNEPTTTPVEATDSGPHPGPGMPTAPEAGQMNRPVRQEGHDTDRLISIDSRGSKQGLAHTTAESLAQIGNSEAGRTFTDQAVPNNRTKYAERRALERHPYAIGAEVRRHSDGRLPSRGIVVSIYPDDGGAQTFHVRFPGDTAATPCTEPDLKPAAPSPANTINQGTVTSLAYAERIVQETASRIRSCELRGADQDSRDITDISTMAAALAESCDLTARRFMRRLEPEIAALSGAMSQPWRPVTAVPAAGLAASGFPYPSRAVIEPRIPGSGHESSTGPAPAQQSRRPGPGGRTL